MSTPTASLPKYRVVDHEVWWCGTPTEGNLVIPADKYGVDVTDPGLKEVCDGKDWRMVFHGRPDMLFAAGPNVVWVEWKNLDDLYSSIQSKRLARELRTGLSMADIVVVAIPRSARGMTLSTDACMEVLRLQTQGIHVLYPCGRSYVYWDEVREVLSSGSNQRRAIAGTDYRKPRTALSGVPGVGAKTEAKLLAWYGTAHTALVHYLEWHYALGSKKASLIEQACHAQTGAP